MLSDLMILNLTGSARVQNATGHIENENGREAVSIKRKLPNNEITRENEIFTRAWAIYSRSRSRTRVHATSII